MQSQPQHSSAQHHLASNSIITSSQVPIPREAMHEIATPLGLADAAAAAALPRGNGDRGTAAVTTATAQTAEALGPVGAAAAAGGWHGERNVQLSADWPCSCVRLRGDTAAVGVAVRGGERDGRRGPRGPRGGESRQGCRRRDAVSQGLSGRSGIGVVLSWRKCAKAQRTGALR